MVQEAIDRSRQGTILDRVSRYASGGDVNANLKPRVSYDKKAVKDFVNQLSDEIDQDAVDATVVPDGSRLAKQAGEAGRAVDKAQMTDEINAAAQSPGRDQPVHAVVKTTKPEVTTKDLPQAYPRYIYIDRGGFTLRFYRPPEAREELHDRRGPAGPRDARRALPRAGQAGEPLLARAQLGLGRLPRRTGDPARPRRPAEGALDRDLRRRRDPRHRRHRLPRFGRLARLRAHGDLRT